MTQEKDVLAKEGYVIILVSLVLALAAGWFNIWAGLGLGLWVLFCVYFFRNPTRQCSNDDGLLICPADGKVIFVGEATETHFLKKKMQRVTVFMSPFNVHVNRSPESGTVLDSVHHSGKFLAAFDERASEENERAAVHLKMDNGQEIVFVQIAGWFARRIVTYAKKGDRLERGKIFGLIKFGSRMDVFFDSSYEPAVKMGQHLQAGQSVLAKKIA